MRIVAWQDADVNDKIKVIAAFKAQGIKRIAVMMDILRVVNCKVVFADDEKSFSIADESKDVLAVAVENYYK
jgi:hypothetical protein